MTDPTTPGTVPGDDPDLDEFPDDDTADDAADDTEGGSRPPRRRRRRRALIALGVVGALVLACAAVAGTYLYSLQHSFYSKSVQVALPQSGTAQGPGENYLLLGSDKRAPEEAEAANVHGQRSDVMMLVHVDAAHENVYVSSFPRDLYVDIPGHGTGRINSALAYGGVPLAVQTVEQYVGVRIDHVALIDFDGIQGLVDELGGVDVMVDQSFEGDGIQFTQGLQHMDGETALVFVRQRKQLAEGDFARNRHQRALLRAIAEKIISRDTLTDPMRIQDLVSTIAPYMTVDDALTATEMVSLGFSMRGIRGTDIHYLEVPHGGPTTTSGGASVVATDEEAMDVFRTALKDDVMASYYSAHPDGS
ncbi:LCP family protein [Brachybacterium huguangmaarense]